MRKLEVRLDWGDEQVVVGRLAEQERRVYFEYDGTFVANPVPLSPFKLPQRKLVQTYLHLAHSLTQ